MKKILFSLLMMLGMKTVLPAQQNHFIYIQSENRQPFTVNFNNKAYHSSGAGYVILPKLQSGDYNFTVKFPQQTGAESKYYVSIDKKDVGFTLNRAGQNNWALTNIQSYVSISPGEKPVYVATQPKSATSSPKQSATGSTRSIAETKNQETNTFTVKSPLRKGINKVMEVQGTKAISIVYVDVSEKGADTIDVKIPVTKKVSTNPEGTAALHKEKMNFLPIETKNIEGGISLVAVDQEGYNTRCVNLASGDDFLRLRKRMAAESNDERMINEAKKAAKNKCFTTVQVKNLSSLFLTDRGRVNFFEALYPLVYDIIQFPSLEKELSEPSSVEKFKSILRK